MGRIIELKRVVVTGMGMVTPLGLDVPTTWQAMIAGKSGIDLISKWGDLAESKDKYSLPNNFALIAGEVKDFQAKDFLTDRQIRQTDPFMQYGLAAAQEAISQANIIDINFLKDNPFDYGVIIGVGMGSLSTIEHNLGLINEGYKRIEPRFILKAINNMLSGYIAMQYNFKGPNYVITSACASGAHAIGEGFEKIRRGKAKAIISGGAESTLTPLGIAGFNIIKALSHKNDEPAKASRPFDKDRNGFVMAEGAGIIILEELEHAKNRGANILAEIAGYGLTNDASHPTEPDIVGAIQCMRQALKDADIEPREIDLINPHGTSTPRGDKNEAQAIMKIFGQNKRPLITGPKSQLGHTLGAAGGIEAILTVLSICDNIVPQILNLDHINEKCQGLNYVRGQAQKAEVKIALSNSFGFGGTNAALVFKKYTK